MKGNDQSVQSVTYYKSLMNKRFLGAWDVPEGGLVILTLSGVGQEEVIGEAGKRSMCMIAYFLDGKPMVLNATNCGALEKVFRSPYIEFWRGPIEIYADKNVRFGNKVVEGLRIKPYPPRVQSQACADRGQLIMEEADKTTAQIAAYTTRRYGRCLCVSCAVKEKAKRRRMQDETEAARINEMIIQK